MKKLLLLLSILSLFQISKANHTLGGEIYWECLSNGKYIFKAKVYMRCGSVGLGFGNETLNITGNPLPRDTNNNSISQITLKPDSNKWFNSGDLSLQCDTNSNSQIACFNSSSISSLQVFVYASDPIELNGVVPTSGWNFLMSLVCCRASYRNLSIGGGQVIKSTLYSHSGQNCLDNSPVFTQNPNYVYYTNTNYKTNDGVMDFDGDSLAYMFDYTYNAPVSAPQVVPLAPSFSFQSNTIGSIVEYDSINGDLDFLDTVGSYPIYIVRKIKSFRHGQLMSETYRETPFQFELFPPVNNPPKISPPFYKGGSTFSFKDTITAGSQININLNVIDTNRINGNLQEIRVQVVSDNIAKDYQFNGICTNPMDTNCAYIPTANAAFNAQRNGYEIRRTALYNGQIRWQTDCSDLSQSGGAKTHYFVVRAQDDMCPIPGLAYETIEVTVIPPTSNPCPIITAIEDKVEWKEKIALYPNPSNGQFTIDSKVGENLNYRIYNLQGQLVQKGALINTTTQIQLQGEKGFYFITINNQNGVRANFKVLKQ